MSEVISFNFRQSGYSQIDYQTSIIGTSDCNDYIPFYSLFAHNMLTFEHDETITVLEYNLPSTPRRTLPRQYTRLARGLSNTNFPQAYHFSVATVPHEINCARGLLYKDNTVYLCLGIKSDYILNTPISEIKESIDYSKFCLFISNEFNEDVFLRNVKKKVTSLYIDEIKALGIDIVYTSNIKEKLFNNNHVLPDFSDVTALMQHLKEVPRILLT